MKPNNNKYSIIYSFQIKKGKELAFIVAWEEMTKLIYQYEGSYGSRLHKVNETLFVAYAQWPDKDTFDHSGTHLPDIANQYREQLRECCIEIKPAFKLESIVVDLLKEKTFNS